MEHHPEFFRDIHSFIDNAVAEMTRLKDQHEVNEMHHQQVCEMLRKEIRHEESDGRETMNKFRYEFDDLVHKRVEFVLEGLEELEQNQKYKDRRQQQQLDSLEEEIRVLKASLGGVSSNWVNLRRNNEKRKPLCKRSEQETFETMANRRRSTHRGNAVEEIKRLQAQIAANHLLHIVDQMRNRVKNAAERLAGENWQSMIKDQDKDGSGQIDFDEFRAMCQGTLKILEPDANLKLVFESLDEDRSGEISIDELIEFVANPVVRMRRRLKRACLDMGGEDETWEDLIRAQDKDQSGQINFVEFKVMCRNVLGLLDREVQIRAVFDAVDTMKTGELTIEEFIQWIKLTEDPPEEDKEPTW